MKKIIGILLVLAAFVFSADYKPFNFESIPQDSASQQDQFDYMLQYKLYGHDFIKMGNDVRIPDKSGWNGTVGNITSNARLTLGGPILANGSISMGDGPNNITGPVRSVDFNLGNVNGSKIASPVCLSGTANANALSAIEDHKTYSFDTNICKDSVPAAPTNLYMPIVDWDNLGADVKLNDIVLSGNDAADTGRRDPRMLCPRRTVLHGAAEAQENLFRHYKRSIMTPEHDKDRSKLRPFFMHFSAFIFPRSFSRVRLRCGHILPHRVCSAFCRGDTRRSS